MGRVRASALGPQDAWVGVPPTRGAQWHHPGECLSVAAGEPPAESSDRRSARRSGGMGTATLPAPSKREAVCPWCHEQFPHAPELYRFPDIHALLAHVEGHS